MDQQTARQALPRLVPPSRHAPGPRYPTPFHFLREARPDPLGYTLRAVREYGDVVRVSAWPLVFHLLAHPDHVKHVLQENNRNYWKGEIVAKMRVLIGDGLFTSEGDVWRRQRRLAQPAFHRQRIEGFAAIMTGATAQALEGWEPAARAAQPIDVMQEMSRLTLAIVGRACSASI